jgi:hypothetical protein
MKTASPPELRIHEVVNTSILHPMKKMISRYLKK